MNYLKNAFFLLILSASAVFQSCTEKEVIVVEELSSMDVAVYKTGYSYQQGTLPFIQETERGWDLYIEPDQVIGFDTFANEVYRLNQPGADLEGRGEGIARFGDSIIFRLVQYPSSPNTLYLEKRTSDRTLLDTLKLIELNVAIRPAGLGMRGESSLVFAYFNVFTEKTTFVLYDFDNLVQFALFSTEGQIKILTSRFTGKTACFLIDGISASEKSAGFLVLDRFNQETIIKSELTFALNRNSVFMTTNNIHISIYSGGKRSTVDNLGYLSELNAPFIELEEDWELMCLTKGPNGGFAGVCKGTQNGSDGNRNLFICEFDRNGKLVLYSMLNSTEEYRSYCASLRYNSMSSWSLMVNKGEEGRQSSGEMVILRPN